jgi:hypothetical protein
MIAKEGLALDLKGSNTVARPRRVLTGFLTSQVQLKRRRKLLALSKLYQTNLEAASVGGHACPKVLPPIVPRATGRFRILRVARRGQRRCVATVLIPPPLVLAEPSVLICVVSRGFLTSGK